MLLPRQSDDAASLRRTGLLQLDLMAVHCTGFVVKSLAVLEEPIVERIRELVKASRQSEGWPWLFALRYHVERNEYAATATFLPCDQPNLYHLDLDFGRGGLRHRRAAPLGGLLDILEHSGSAPNMHCVVSFRYQEDDGRTLVPIPINLPSAIDLPATDGMKLEIRGLRLTQLDRGGDVDYSVIVDRPLGSAIYHSVSFGYVANLSSRLPGELLRRAAGISGGLFALNDHHGE